VKNIASFQFELTYDSGILEYEDAQKADVLGSTGREVVCNPISESGIARYVRHAAADAARPDARASSPPSTSRPLAR
jgi:hypothetical protein